MTDSAPDSVPEERRNEIFAVLREEAEFAESMRADISDRPSPRQTAHETTPHAPAAVRRVSQEKKPRRIGFEIFFAASLLLALTGAAYDSRDTLAMTFPQFAGQINALASVINTIKAGLFSH